MGTSPNIPWALEVLSLLSISTIPIIITITTNLILVTGTLTRISQSPVKIEVYFS